MRALWGQLALGWVEGPDMAVELTATQLRLRLVRPGMAAVSSQPRLAAATAAAATTGGQHAHRGGARWGLLAPAVARTSKPLRGTPTPLTCPRLELDHAAGLPRDCRGNPASRARPRPAVSSRARSATASTDGGQPGDPELRLPGVGALGARPALSQRSQGIRISTSVMLLPTS